MIVHFIFISVLSLVFTFGLSDCASHESTAVGVNAENSVQNIATAMPPKESSDELRNEDGWAVPSVTSMKKTAVRNIVSSSASGAHIKLEMTTFIPGVDYDFEVGGSPAGEKFAVLAGKLRLRQITQLKVGQRIFSYVLLVRSSSSLEGKKSANETNRPGFYYQILDKDGDGRFETLIGGSSENSYVPQWVTK